MPSSEKVTVEDMVAQNNYLLRLIGEVAEKIDLFDSELRTLFNNIGEVFFTMDIKMQKFVQVSDSCLKVFGYTSDELIANPVIWKKLIHPEDIGCIIAGNRGMMARQKEIVNRCRIIHRSGEVRRIEIRMIPKLNGAAGIVRIDGICRDITENELTQKIIDAKSDALEISEKKFRLLFDNSLEGLLIAKPDGSFLQANQAFCELLGYTHKELLKLNRQKITLPDDPGLIEGLKRRSEMGSFSGCIKLIRKDGKIIDAEISTSVFDDGKGEKNSYVCVREITEKLKLQQKLEDSENRFRALIENSHDLLILNGANGEVLYCSPSFQTILGYKSDEISQASFYDTMYPEDVTRIRKMFKQLLAHPGESVTSEWRQKHKNGSWRWMEGTATNLLNDLSVRAIVNNYRDITQRKEVEQKLEALNHSLEKQVADRTEQLNDANKALESFSYSVAHDLQAPLRIIGGYAQVLEEDYGKLIGPDGLELLQVMTANTKVMSRLITDLLNFSRITGTVLNSENIDFDQLVPDVIESIKQSQPGINPEFILHPLGKCFGDGNLLRQVWANLIGNAVKYSGKNPHPIVEIGTTVNKEKKLFYVKDNGIGFDMGNSERLFNVFFRMHKSEQYEEGTGVGLALAHNIITRHGGKICAEAEVNKGATFYFFLPSN